MNEYPGFAKILKAVEVAISSAHIRIVASVFALLAFIFSPALSNAAPTDCIGTSVDGKAKCTAPILGAYSYDLCNVSQLYIAYGHEAVCAFNILGLIIIPDPDTGLQPFDVTTTDPAKLNAMITCMSGINAPIWASVGTPVGTNWCPEPPVTNKYGVEVVGVSLGIPTNYSGVVASRTRYATCPAKTVAVGDDPNLPDYCKAVPKCNCEKTTDPMGIVNGDQSLDETDIPPYSDSPLQFSRSYSSSAYYRPVNAAKLNGVAYMSDNLVNPDWDLTPGFGDYWRHNFSSTVMAEGQPYLAATALRQSGVSKHFTTAGTSVLNEDTQGDSLLPTLDANSVQTGWLYRAGDQEEKYLLNGQLATIQTRSGRIVSLTYDAVGHLVQATDDVGRFLKFGYNPQHQMTSILDVAGNTFNYAYTGQMLSSVTFPDNATRTYLYHENPTGANGDLFGMTGIVDELGVRYATFGYETATTPAYTQLAGGVDTTVRNVVDASHVSITNAMGSVQTFATGIVSGVNKTTSMAQPAGSGNAASTTSHTYDAAGAIASRDDANAQRTCRVNDQTRLLETMRVEGLATTQACAAVETIGVTLPAGSRMINTLWHPTWPVVARTAEPQKITTFVYNGQPDPTNAGATLTCAPATALLLDGKPIVVLCKQVEQATTDLTGSAGFTATAQAGVTARVSTWTYNALGQVLTAVDPRKATTTYTYYPSTSFTGTGMSAVGHTSGDLQSIKDPVGLTTTFSTYNLYGQPLTVVDANSVTTTNTYDNRRRLTRTTTGTDATTYTYDAAGQAKTVKLANGLVLTNTYDGAHRLTQVADSAGNKIVYTLDNAGNRIGEQVKDASGVLARNVSRSFDILSRVQSVTGAAQ